MKSRIFYGVLHPELIKRNISVLKPNNGNYIFYWHSLRFNTSEVSYCVLSLEPMSLQTEKNSIF